MAAVSAAAVAAAGMAALTVLVVVVAAVNIWVIAQMFTAARSPPRPPHRWRRHRA